MDYAQRFDALQSFFDKYEEDIEKAPENSSLGALRNLDDALTRLCSFSSEDSETHIDDAVNDARDLIEKAMLYLAQSYAFVDGHMLLYRCKQAPDKICTEILDGMPACNFDICKYEKVKRENHYKVNPDGSLDCDGPIKEL